MYVCREREREKRERVCVCVCVCVCAVSVSITLRNKFFLSVLFDLSDCGINVGGEKQILSTHLAAFLNFQKNTSKEK